uniref:Uncharacterized protein n=1 Tax=Pseudonaja textilis TaxID=8673 RepID=A0A670YUZ6_PSETE
MLGFTRTKGNSSYCRQPQLAGKGEAPPVSPTFPPATFPVGCRATNPRRGYLLLPPRIEEAEQQWEERGTPELQEAATSDAQKCQTCYKGEAQPLPLRSHKVLTGPCQASSFPLGVRAFLVRRKRSMVGGKGSTLKLLGGRAGDRTLPS